MLSVCLPMGDKVHAGFAHDLAVATGYYAATQSPHMQFHIRQGTILSEERSHLCDAALESDAEWLIFVDSDMRFPKDTFERLISHGEPIVGTNCSKRRRPVGPTSRTSPDGLALDPLWPDYEKKGLEQVATTGFGLIAIHHSVFKAIAFPWFDTPWIEDNERHIGEDVFFCVRCREAGIPIYIDHDLSWEVRHIGQHEFSMEDLVEAMA